MYARQVEGYPEPLLFGVSGKLIMNVLVMFDRQTGSLWSQILGQAVDGPLKGTALRPLPVTQTTWAQWLALHPRTTALKKEGIYSSLSADPYASYYRSQRAGVLGESREDSRLPAKEVGLGTVLNGQPAFFPFSRLTEEPVVNSTVGNEPVLVLFSEQYQTALLFRRHVAGRVLTFRLAPESDKTSLLLEDVETGTRWNGWLGAATDGPLAGARLERVPATTSFWFGWKDWHPNTEVYGEKGETK